MAQIIPVLRFPLCKDYHDDDDDDINDDDDGGSHPAAGHLDLGGRAAHCGPRPRPGPAPRAGADTVHLAVVGAAVAQLGPVLAPATLTNHGML